MSKTSWYVHVDGENIGPFSTEKVSSMLQQNRFQFVDYIWAKHLTKWHRISDLDQFASLMPSYPKIGIPAEQTSDSSEIETTQEPKPVARPQPKAEPPPEPKAPAKSSQAKATPAKAAAPAKPAASATTAAIKPSVPTKAKAEPAASTEEFPAVRKFMRVPAKGEKVILSDKSFTVINISEGGLFIKSSEPLNVGTEVKLELHIPGQEKELPMTGVVIRHGVVDKQAGFAIEFTRLNPAIKRILQTYVRSHSEEE
jgi:uncharacterized protein (TIGR02266 family)